VKILLIVECLQSVQYVAYISAKLSHYKEEKKKNVRNNLMKPAKNILILRVEQHNILEL
jgi:hypothetical protein